MNTYTVNFIDNCNDEVCVTARYSHAKKSAEQFEKDWQKNYDKVNEETDGNWDFETLINSFNEDTDWENAESDDEVIDISF